MCLCSICGGAAANTAVTCPHIVPNAAEPRPQILARRRSRHQSRSLEKGGGYLKQGRGGGEVRVYVP